MTDPTQDQGLTPALAEHILARLSESGQPPEAGVLAINVGNQSYLEVLEQEYLQRILKGGSSFKLVEGYFGGGKTHFLYCVRELAWRHGFATAFVELSPAECPYDDPQKVYAAVARSLSGPRAPDERHVVGGLGELLDNLADDLLERHGADAARAYIARTARRIPCESHSYRQAVTGYLGAAIEGREEERALLGAWLTGEPVSASQVRHLGVFEAVTRSNGFAMLRALSQVLVGLEQPGLVLLFDEVDRNLSVGLKRIRAIGDNLRQMIDLCGRAQLPNTLFLYAVPPEFMRNVVPEYPALYQRLRSPIPFSRRSPQAPLIDLGQLDLEPVPLLEALGERLLLVFELARGVTFDRELQRRNIALLARTCVEREFELNHRRLFVKLFSEALLRQQAEGEEDLSVEQEEQRIIDAVERFGRQDERWEDASGLDEGEIDELEDLDDPDDPDDPGDPGDEGGGSGPRRLH